MSTIAENIAILKAEIARACDVAGRDPSAITIIAISKRHPEQRVIEAMAAGLRHFGENRVEEARIKIPDINAQVENPPHWHMVGHIQSRKAKQIPVLFDTVHSVDSVKLANRLSKQCVADDTTLNILLEINISGEESKAGFDAFQWRDHNTKRASLLQNVQEIAALPALKVCGLMTMAPHTDDMEATRPVFRDLAALRDVLQDELAIQLPDLSMGMSNDYPVAIEEGATLIRPGTAIFGARKY